MCRRNTSYREKPAWDTSESREARKETARSVGDGVKTTGNQNIDAGHILPIALSGDKVRCLTARADSSPCVDRGQNIIFQPIAFNGRQDPVYGQVTGALDTDRATQCVLHPKVVGTICASGAGTNRPAGQGNETDLCIVHSFPLVGHGAYSEGGAGTIREKYGDCGGGSETLVAQCVTTGTGRRYDPETETLVTHGYAVRRLLPLECERLQSFPDNWTNIPGASDTARYKAIGNSLVCNIAEWIFSQIVVAEKELIACQNYQENSQQKK